MPYYLAPYVEERDDAHGGRRVIRAVGYEGQPGAACLNFWTRAGVDGRALLRLPVAHADPRLEKLGEDKGEVLTPAARGLVTARLGVTELRAVGLGDVFGELMLSPVAGRWRGLVPTRERFELWLGGELLWAGPRVIAGGATDTFTRANETPVAAPWTQLTGSTNTINLVSNALQAAATGDKFYYYSGAVTGADQYSQFLQSSAPDTSDWGPACRIGENGFSGYWASLYALGPSFNGFDAGTFFSPASVTVTATDGHTYRLEAEGTTLRFLDNGSHVTGSPTTDATLTGAGDGVGIFLYQINGAIDDFDGGDISAAAATWGPLLALRNNRLVAA